MHISRIIEFIAAVVVILLATFLYGYSMSRALEIYRQDEGTAISVTSFLFAFLILVVPSVCLGIGAYTHAIKQMTWGFLLVLIAAAVNNFLIVALFNGIVWAYPGWVVLLFIIEFFLVLVAVAAALFSNRNPTN